jgi:hypothetical protein
MKRCHWVMPKLVCQVKFTEWTRDDRLRQPVFLGIREDKSASEVIRGEGQVGRRIPRPSRIGTNRDKESSIAVQNAMFLIDIKECKALICSIA